MKLKQVPDIKQSLAVPKGMKTGDYSPRGERFAHLVIIC